MKNFIISIILIISVIPLTSRECFNDAYKQYENEDYKESINSIMSCLNDIEEDADPVEMDHAYFGIASSYLKLGQLDSSLKYTLIAYNNENVNKLPTSKTLNQLGNLYINKGLNHQAIYYLKNAVEINKSDNNRKLLQLNYGNLGIAYQEIKLIDSSSFYYKAALELTEEGKSESNIIKNNLATLYFLKNDITHSIRILESIKEIYLSSNTDVERYLVLTNKILFNLLTKKPISKSDHTLLNDYLHYCETRNDFYSADANFKLSIYSLLYKNTEEGIKYLNKANTTYVSVGNIGLAKEITSRFTDLMKNPPTIPFKYTLNDLNNKQIQIYSASLNSEIETKLKAENYINDLNIKLNKAEFNYYITLSILISVLLFVGIIIQRVFTSNKIRQIVNGYLSYLTLINQLDAQNKNNYSNGDIDGWVMVIKDHDSTRFAEWGNLIEGKNGLNYDADDFVNNVEWLTHSASANDLIIAGHSDTDDEDFDQFSSTKVDNNSGGGNNDIFMQKFDYIDTTFWGTSKVAFYGNGQDDQLYDMYYNSYYDSLALVGKTKSFNPTFPNFTDFTEDAVSFDRVNDNISYYHGVVFMTDNDVDLEWGSFFGDDVVGSPHPHLLPYVFTPDPQDFTATGVIIQSNSEVLFTGNTSIDTLIWKEDVFQEFNAGMIDGMIVRLNENGQTLSKQVNQYYTNEIENTLDINIFPNPTKFDLNIEYNSDISVNGIKLYNSVGKLIYQFYNKIDKIDVSNLPTGVYHIQFDFINSKQNYSFIKQ